MAAGPLVDPSTADCPLEAGRLLDLLGEGFPVDRLGPAWQVASRQVICLLHLVDPSAEDQLADPLAEDQLADPSAEDQPVDLPAEVPLAGPLLDQEGDPVASASPAATSHLQESKGRWNKTSM